MATDATDATAVAALKAEGNKCLKEGQHDEAISCYVRALEAMGPMSETASRAQDEERAVLYANCSLARLQRGTKGDAQAAWADARRAVELAPSYAKAHQLAQFSHTSMWRFTYQHANRQ